jgi:hypothetical protein
MAPARHRDSPRSQLEYSAGWLLCAAAVVGGVYMIGASWDVADGAPEVTYTVIAGVAAWLAGFGGVGLVRQWRPTGRWWVTAGAGVLLAAFWFFVVLMYSLSKLR